MGLFTLGAVSDEELAATSPAADRHDVINMQYTVRRLSKIVMLTHRNILNNGYYIGERRN